MIFFPVGPLVILLNLAAVHADEPAVFPGHSYHGEAFNEGPRQRAYLMGGTGGVRFPITTRSKEARKFFEQGVGQLHGFWYFEAERSFRQVAQLDPDCAMAYWGMAMANHENPKRATGFIKKARALLRNAPRREQLYVECLTDYHLGRGDVRARRQQYVDTLKKISTEYPDDIEARAFYVVRCWQFKVGLQGAALDKVLDEIFRANPLHPAHHFRIHLWDGANPSKALGSAALCGEAAPRIAHMWHMPGHTYDKLKRYAEAAWQQEASSRADHAHMMHDRVLPDQIHNYAHNQEWLIRSLSHIGRVQDAVALAKNLIELPRHPKYNTATRGGRTASYGRTRLLELLERYELWDETLRLADTMYLETIDTPAEQVRRLRLLGLAQASKGDRKSLLTTIELLRKQSPSAKIAGPKGKNPPGKGGKGKGKGFVPKLGGIAQRDNAIRELQLLDKLLDGDTEVALEILKGLRSVNPARQARYYLQAGDKAKAEQLARQAADAGKNQVAPLALYVEMLHANDKVKECAEAFERLRKMSGNIDSLDTPAFKRLAPVAKERKLPADWRIKAKLPADFGKRPPLASIGPLVWQPTPGPAWSLPDANGKTISSRDYAGRPTLLIFYLGHGCSHCMEQVSKFSADEKKFKDAGISIVAIGTDTRETLATALNGAGAKKFAFPVGADPRCDVFKQYRAYDDFENQPLHGTFLLDARGLVRWHDIGHEPFLDSAFLLNEAKRLLALPPR
ncbi:MAG: redoxin domain-containing protein [Planctomycetes bacterium]|nr:redoxin domain-containing protein [Planctomycetota bacterium]